MKGLTDLIPKALIKVGNKTLLDHTLSLQHKPNMNIIINAHYKHFLIENHLKDNPKIKVSVEKPSIYETGGGLKNAVPKMTNDTVFTLNSDSIFKGISPLLLLEKAWDPDSMEALLLLVPPCRIIGHTGKGDFSINKGKKIDRNETGSVYTGAQIIKTGRVCKIKLKKFSLNLAWDEMLSERTIYGIEYPGFWIDVGTPSGIKNAEVFLKETQLNV
jgi:MurNAc alpha-1-phosphate uridylyltransferase